MMMNDDEIRLRYAGIIIKVITLLVSASKLNNNNNKTQLHQQMKKLTEQSGSNKNEI